MSLAWVLDHPVASAALASVLSLAAVGAVVGWGRVGYWVYAQSPLGSLVHAVQVKMAAGTTHTATEPVDNGFALVYPVCALSDNYMYLLVDKATGAAAAVDACDPARMLGAVADANERRRGGPPVELRMILTTHYHLDHSGGNEELAERASALADRAVSVVVPAEDAERIRGPKTVLVRHGDCLSVGSLRVYVLFAGCHTPGHVVFWVEREVPEAGDVPLLFTGDAIFGAGVGKFFEAAPASLATLAAALRAHAAREALLFCGHEYTASNLAFAHWVLPDDDAIEARVRERLGSEGRERRERGKRGERGGWGCLWIGCSEVFFSAVVAFPPLGPTAARGAGGEADRSVLAAARARGRVGHERLPPCR